jgi:murein DD-endopeptidase MepM/ murein hydrolase activator NlpD
MLMTLSKHTRSARLVLLAAMVTALLASLLAAQPDPALAEPTAAELAAQVKELNSEVAEAGRAYENAYWRLHETELRLERLEGTLAQTEAELSEAERLLSLRAEAMYRRTDDDVISFILGSSSFAEMASRAELWQRIASQDAEIVDDTTRLRNEYEAQISAIERERDAQEAETASLRRQRDSLQSRLSSKQDEYEELQARLEAAIKREAERNQVTYEPPSSANGMTFPVAGSHYYSDTWGASRSGGRRRHKGTDIMAARGVPCVAVLPGTVSAKTSGLGGRTIWLTADNGWQFYYAHLDTWTVTSGRVSQGQVIGTVGSTGNASYTAPHLHFEIHPGGGAAVNPYPYLRAMQGY